MANNENLKPIRSTSEAREKGRKGGKKSGETRKKKKELKELLEIALSQNDFLGQDLYTSITMALINKAIEGDVRAYETIRDTLGQKPTEKFEMSTSDICINIVGDTDDNA